MRVWLSLVLLVCAVSLNAQQIIPTDSVSRIPFDAKGVNNYVEESISALESIQANLKSTKNSSRLFAEYEKVSNKYQALRSDSIPSDSTMYTLWLLADLTAKWNRYEIDIRSEREKMNSLSNKYQEGYTKLTLLKRRWDVTQEKELQNAPKIINEQIDTLKLDIEVAMEWIEDSLSITIEKYKAISREYGGITNVLERINDLSENEKSDIFSRDARPIVEEMGRSHGYPNIFAQIGQSYSMVASDIRDFLSLRSTSAKWHVFLILAIVGLFVFFKRNFKASEKEVDEDTKTAIYLINNPIPVGLLFAIFISFWYYTAPPQSVIQLLFLAILFPILYLARSIVSDRFRMLFYVIAGSYALFMVSELMPAFPFTQRILILMISILLAPFWIYSLIKNRRDFGTTGFDRWVIRFMVIYSLFAVAALLANWIGSLSLARVLTRTVVVNGAVGLILILLYRVFQSLMEYFIRSSSGQKLNLVQKNGPVITQKILFYTKLFFIYLFFSSFLSSLFIRDYVVDYWQSLRDTGAQFGEIYLSIGMVIDFILIIIVFSILANIFRALIEIEILPRTKVKKGIPMAAGLLTRYTLLLLGFFMALAAAGISLDRVGLLIGALGVGIGFGLQKVVANFVSGLILVFERPIRAGDTVMAAGSEGVITNIGIRASKIRDWDGAEVIIPNGDLITQKVTNWTYSDANRRIEIIIRTESDADPNKVIEICKETAKAHKDVLRFPEPLALFLGFREYYLEFRVLFWVEDNLLGARSEVGLGIWDGLKEAGIRIPVQKQEWLGQDENQVEKKANSFPKEDSEKKPKDA